MSVIFLRYRKLIFFAIVLALHIGWIGAFFRASIAPSQTPLLETQVLLEPVAPVSSSIAAPSRQSAIAPESHQVVAEDSKPVSHADAQPVGSVPIVSEAQVSVPSVLKPQVVVPAVNCKKTHDLYITSNKADRTKKVGVVVTRNAKNGAQSVQVQSTGDAALDADIERLIKSKLVFTDSDASCAGVQVSATVMVNGKDD